MGKLRFLKVPVICKDLKCGNCSGKGIKRTEKGLESVCNLFPQENGLKPLLEDDFRIEDCIDAEIKKEKPFK